jgi:hypothetical protein
LNKIQKLFMRKNMKYRYGPIVWNCSSDEDESGNYFWPGLPPCAYDDSGIPIDIHGKQCLPGTSIIHPNYEPTDTFYSDVVCDDLPTIESARQWLDDNFLIVTDRQVAKFIIRWYGFKVRRASPAAKQLWSTLVDKYKTRDRLVDAVWSNLPK